MGARENVFRLHVKEEKEKNPVISLERVLMGLNQC